MGKVGTTLAVFENNGTGGPGDCPGRFCINYGPGTDFSLDVDQVKTQDSGSYFCLVNDRNKPTNLYTLAVQGEEIILLNTFSKMILNQAKHVAIPISDIVPQTFPPLPGSR